MLKKKQNSKLKIIPLGGLEQIGMNITAFEYEDSIIVVDCGLSFPEDDMLGIDLVIPDVTYLKENLDRVKGFFITHGHEDHIGAIPYVLRDVNVPIYATKLTMGIIEHKLREHNMLTKVKRKVVKYGQHINLGCFRVEFIKTNHSIADAAALAIYTPAGIIVHTGDFKIDYTPVFGESIDLQRFAELGKKGVLTGTPLRPELFRGSRAAGLALAGFYGQKPVLLMTGGSLGAQSVNRCLREALPELLTRFDVLHLCGKGNLDESLMGMKGYCQKEFLSDEMPDALAVADVVLSRAGSNTLSELLALHKPMLLVPYPLGASRGDQIENAKSYARQGLARVLMQEDMTARTLTDALFKLLDERAELLAALEAYPVKDGTQAVLELIEDARKK